MIRGRRARAAIAVGLSLATAIALLWAAWFEHGVFWPDEVLQTLEQGHRFAFGYGLVPWEFRDGIRSWFVPGIIGIVMKIGASLGIESGLALARLVKLLVAMGTVAGGYATAQIGQRLGGTRAMLVSAAFYAMNPLVVYFGSRVFTDTISMPLVAFGALALTTERANPARSVVRPLTAGLILGIATLIRHQNLIFVATAFLTFAVARRWRQLARFSAGAAAGILIGGVLDWLTWGFPFASLIRYAQFHIRTRGAGWGEEPASFYATTYFTAMGWLLVVLGIGFFVMVPRARALGALVLVYVALHVLIKHKETRFLLPVLPIAIGMASAGVVALADAALRRWTIAPALALGALSCGYITTGVFDLTRATFASMGDAEFGDTSAWHFDENASVLFSRVGVRGDACGVIYYGKSGHDWGHTGTYSYLHRDVPLYHSRDGSLVAYANYIVGPRGVRLPSGYAEVDTRDTYAIYQRSGGCAAAPEWYSRDSEK